MSHHYTGSFHSRTSSADRQIHSYTHYVATRKKLAAIKFRISLAIKMQRWNNAQMWYWSMNWSNVTFMFSSHI